MSSPGGVSGPTRRILLLGGLAAALGVSACGRTTITGVPDAGTATPSPGSGSSPKSPATETVEVSGSYSIHDAGTGTTMDVTVTTTSRVIHANGLPNHQTGSFPNANNPNTISAQNYQFELPLVGTRVSQPTALVLPQPFGIAVNGVLFDPLAAEWFQRDPSSGWTIEAISPTARLGLDTNNAHVQPNGAYHYHGLPLGIVGQQDPLAHSPLLGWAGDGFPIYARFGYTDPTDPHSGITEMTASYRLRTGTRSSGPGGTYDGTYTEDFEFVNGLGALDIANGRYGVTPEYPRGTYYYVLTRTFPFIPRYLAGAIASSFVRSGKRP